MDTNSTNISRDHHNWLSFSLSNNNDDSIFQPPLFDPAASTGSVDHQENGVPKLEDFLGGGADQLEIYQQDSGLRSIAAGFLQGFSEEHSNSFQPQKKWDADVAPPLKKAVETFSQRTSIYRGVTRHRWTGRYEAHLWDNSCRRQGQSRKGRQVYLGGYDKEEKAARAYDLAAIKYWGPTTTTNFPVMDYEKEIDEMKNMSRQEFVASLRRKSSGFSRGASMYRGVTRHHQHGRWQARIGRVAGNKDLYLGTFSTQEEAAEAYDIAAIKFRGLNAVTNFDMSRYDVQSIASCSLPVGGGVSSKPKSSADASALDPNKDLPVPSAHFEMGIKQGQRPGLWPALGYQNPSIDERFQETALQEAGGFYYREHGAADESVVGSDGANWVGYPCVHLLEQSKSVFQRAIYGVE